MTYKCLIIDDEPLARDILENYINQVEFLELAGKCKSALEAINILKNQRIDLVFLDIQMPELNGIEFLRSIKVKPSIIFTTAYEQYAVESYDLEASDYLLKPISFQRFLKSIDKFTASAAVGSIISKTSDAQKDNFIFVNTGGKIIRIFLNDILFIRSLGDYVEINTRTARHIIREIMKNLEEMLDTNDFIRIHKSYIVTLSKIDVIEGNEVRIGNDRLPIGKLYKTALLSRINKRKIG